MDYRIAESTWYRLGTSPEKHHHDAPVCATRWKDLEKHVSEKRRCLEVPYQYSAVRGASDMEAGACCSGSTPRHATPRTTPRHATHAHTRERRATYSLKIPTNAYMHKEKTNQKQTEYTGLSIEIRSSLEGRYSFICHFIHFVPMELILLFRTDHANLSKPIPDI